MGLIGDGSPQAVGVPVALGVGGRRDEGPICRAPSTSMWLDTSGVVKACCMNHGHPLGRIGERPLRDIWRGAATRALRRRLAEGDLGLGCDECALAVRDGDERTAFFHTYEHLEYPGDDPPWPRQLELSLSNVCNLQCVMCDGEHSSMIRAHREGRPPLPEVYGDEFFDELDEFLPHLERLVFMGGEPFLARPSLRVMHRLVDLGLTPRVVVITNGTQWNPQVERILEHLPVHVTVSIDGSTAATVEAIRVGVSFEQLTANIDRLRSMAARRGSGFELCYCLMRDNAHELGDLLAYADGLDCDVYVKRVFTPTSMGLQHAPADVLEAVVGVLEADDDRRRSTLGRNLRVWETELDALRRLLERRRVDGTRERAPDDATTDAVAETLALLDGEELITDAAIVVADAANVVEKVVGVRGDADSLGLASAAGGSLDELIGLLGRRFGSLERSDVRRPARGNEVRTLVFGGGGTATRVVAVLVDERDGRAMRWLVGRSAGPRETIDR